jgi:hypothetical protein
VFLGLKVRPVGDEDATIGLRPQRLRVACRRYAASENPDAGSNHLFVERVDFLAHRFVHRGRVKIVGEVTCNQIMRHIFSCNGLVAQLALARSLVRCFERSFYSRRAWEKSTLEADYFFNSSNSS